MTTLKQALKRIEELEQRVKKLEANAEPSLTYKFLDELKREQEAKLPREPGAPYYPSAPYFPAPHWPTYPTAPWPTYPTPQWPPGTIICGLDGNVG